MLRSRLKELPAGAFNLMHPVEQAFSHLHFRDAQGFIVKDLRPKHQEPERELRSSKPKPLSHLGTDQALPYFVAVHSDLAEAGMWLGLQGQGLLGVFPRPYWGANPAVASQTNVKSRTGQLEGVNCSC